MKLKVTVLCSLRVSMFAVWFQVQETMKNEQQFVDKERCASLDKDTLGTHYIWGKVYGASCVASIKFKKSEVKNR